MQQVFPLVLDGAAAAQEVFHPALGKAGGFDIGDAAPFDVVEAAAVDFDKDGKGRERVEDAQRRVHGDGVGVEGGLPAQVEDGGAVAGDGVMEPRRLLDGLGQAVAHPAGGGHDEHAARVGGLDGRAVCGGDGHMVAFERRAVHIQGEEFDLHAVLPFQFDSSYHYTRMGSRTQPEIDGAAQGWYNE